MPFDLGHWLPEFPIRETCLYLNHAAVCPLPFPVAEAMRRQVTDQQLTGYANADEWHNSDLACRHLGAEILGCDHEDISIIRSTSEGLSLVAEGLSWEPDDEVLVGEEEFAANVAPWLNLQHRGVRVVRYRQPDGRIDPADVEAAITDRTRLLSVSWVAFHSGWIAPLAALATLCRERGVLMVVDGRHDDENAREGHPRRRRRRPQVVARPRGRRSDGHISRSAAGASSGHHRMAKHQT